MIFHSLDTLSARPASLAPSLAALVNSTAAHALDFDDLLGAATRLVAGAFTPRAIAALRAELRRRGTALLDAVAAYLPLPGYRRERGYESIRRQDPQTTVIAA